MSTDEPLDSAQRNEELRRGRRLEIFTVAWKVVEAVATGRLAGSIALIGWWWADPIAALLMVPMIAQEGWEAVQEA